MIPVAIEFEEEPVALKAVAPQGPPFHPLGASEPWTAACRAPWRAASEIMWLRRTPVPRSTMPNIRVRHAVVVIAASLRVAPRRCRGLDRRIMARHFPFDSVPILQLVVREG